VSGQRLREAGDPGYRTQGHPSQPSCDWGGGRGRKSEATKCWPLLFWGANCLYYLKRNIVKTRTTDNNGFPFGIPFPSITQHEIEAGACETNNFDAFSMPFVSNSVCEPCSQVQASAKDSGWQTPLSHIQPILHIVEIDGEGIQRLRNGLREWVG